MKEVSVDKAKYNKLMSDVRELRSTVVEFAITIEQIISEILIDYLGNDLTKKIIEKHLFSDALDFDKKIMLFNALNKKLLPKINGDYKVGDKLGYIKSLRNFMAHCNVHTPPNFIDNYDGDYILFGSYTQREEHVVVTIYKNIIVEDMKTKIYSAELFYETCKSVIKHLLEIHDKLEQ